MARWRDAKQGRAPQKDSKQVKTPSPASSSASLFNRFKAFTTDSFLITTPIIYIVMYLIMGGGNEFSANLAIGWALILAFHFPIIMFFWIKKAQTPGMKAYEMKLVNANTKEPITIIQAFVRYMTTLFAVVSFFLIFLPYFRKDRKTFQDLFSNTILVPEE